MTRLELLVLLYSLEALLKAGQIGEAQEIIQRTIEQAENKKN